MADPLPLLLPSGYGFRSCTPAEVREALAEADAFLDALFLWEPPRRRGQYRYVIGADVGDGLGQDRSVAQVLRVGTIAEPAEQVAEYASDQMLPMGFAYVLQTLGQYYRDSEGYEALMAIECNNHGLSTQDTLQLHLGYTHFYRWEYYEQADPASRYSNKIGWVTTPRTRPLLLDKFKSAITTLDPVTQLPDLVTHSALLHSELKDFQTDGALWEAEAARGAHDDAILSLAIANYVAWRLQGGEQLPLEERRRHRHAQEARLADAAAQSGLSRPDWRNTPATAEEASLLYGTDDEAAVDALLYPYDARRVEY